MKISKNDACSFLLTYQKLTDSQEFSGVDGVLDFMKKVRCIQYDPLNIIGRNTDLVLQSRVRDYRPQMLEQLLYEDRLLIDGWDKMMSIYLQEDWPYFNFIRQQRAFEAISTLKNRKSEDAILYINTVLDILAKNGPMQSKHIQLGSVGSGRWGHRNLSSAAMDYLFHLGKVGVFKKIGVNKVYDLIENLLLDDIINQPNPFKTEHDFMKWYVYRRLGSVGMLWNKNGGGWLATLMPNKELRQRFLDEYIADELVKCIEVEGISAKFYIRSEDAGIFDTNNLATSKAVRFIAPLDNLMWDRDMLLKLFDFKYTWEVYIPASKRKYGYYVIPVLYGNRFVARFEPEKSESYIKIKNWWWEKDISVSNDMIDLVLLEMERLAKCLDKKDGVD
ncbi:MAG: winged helix DNA-binding domain-containing protein, partial [Oscillospiraceae bacterium]|nr:winged helix DNA-binding domain-containing protein [Oscillospiraceae bacterium]